MSLPPGRPDGKDRRTPHERTSTRSVQAAVIDPFVDALRGVRRRRGGAFVVIGGLTAAQAACLLVALLAIALAQPAPSVADPARVVVLDFKGNPPGEPSSWFTASPVAFGPMLKARGAPLDLISRVASGSIDIDIDGRTEPATLLAADPDAVPLLGWTALQGDLRATLAQHDGIAISTNLLRKLWGELPAAQALGRRITSQGMAYTVSAVVPAPDPRSPWWDANPMVGDALAIVGFETQGNPMPRDEREAIYSMTGRVYARLRPETSKQQVGPWMRDAFVANPLYAQLPAAWRVGREAAYFRGLPLTELPFEGAANALRWRLLGAVGAACGLLLLLAASNAINLHAADLLQRQRETALRRSLGADHGHLLRLWSAEVLWQLLPAAAVALLLAWWLAPAVANWMGLPPNYPVADPLPPLALAGLLASVLVLLPAIAAAPAWAALQRAPAPALQGRTASDGPWGRRARQGLLALQLGGTLLLLSLAGVMTVQQRHLLHADHGYDTRNRLCLEMAADPQTLTDSAALAEALSRQAAIAHWAYSSSRTAGDTLGQRELYASEGRQRQTLRTTTVSPDFFATYGMTLLAGAPRLGNGETTVVIDAKAARGLGYATPQAAIGALLHAGGGYLQEGNEARRVVAVVKDVSLESARALPLPQAFVLSEAPQWNITVYGADPGALRLALDTVWAAHGRHTPHEITSADAQRADVYREEERLTTLLAAAALLAVAVAMIGAYALVADTLRRRRTELVLRRLHGAGTWAIVGQIVREFAGPFALAAGTGLPLAVWLGQRYLSGFVDRGDTASGLVWPLACATMATLVVTAVAALRHLRTAVRVRPIEALR